MQDSVREVLAYLKTARELEIGLMKLDKLEKHSNWKILQLEGKAYPEFQPLTRALSKKGLTQNRRRGP